MLPPSRACSLYIHPFAFMMSLRSRSLFHSRTDDAAAAQSRKLYRQPRSLDSARTLDNALSARVNTPQTCIPASSPRPTSSARTHPCGVRENCLNNIFAVSKRVCVCVYTFRTHKSGKSDNREVRMVFFQRNGDQRGYF